MAGAATSDVDDMEDLDDYTKEFEVDTSAEVRKTPREKETDPHRIQQRQKQVDFGKNTLGYQSYIEEIPRHKRRPKDPKTPDVYQKCSKRSFDGQIKKWRRLLHQWDPPVEQGEEVVELPVPMPLPLPTYTTTKGGASPSGVQNKANSSGSNRHDPLDRGTPSPERRAQLSDDVIHSGSKRSYLFMAQEQSAAASGEPSDRIRRRTLGSELSGREEWTEVTKDETFNLDNTIYDDWDEEVAI